MVARRAGNGLHATALAILWAALILAGALAILLLGAQTLAAFDDPPAALATDASELVERLGDSDYFVRDGAQRMLEERGFEAIDALTAGSFHDDLEVSRRSAYLLKRLWAIEAPKKIDRGDDRDRVRDLLHGATPPNDAYTNLDEPRRLTRIAELAKLPEAVGSEPLCRLARYEISPILAKQAALAIIKDWPASLGRDGNRGPAMLATLGADRRPAIEWVRACVEVGDDVPKARARFAELASAERKLLAESSEHTSAEILLSLLSFRHTLARRAGDLPDAYAIAQDMVDLEPPVSPTLAMLVDELVTQQDVATLNAVLMRFAPRVSQSATLLYMLAELKKKQGAEAEGEEFARRALELDPTDAGAHFVRAVDLGRRGLWTWSEREAAFVRAHPSQAYRVNLDSDSEKAKEKLYGYLGQDENIRATRIREIARATEREIKEPERIALLCRLARFEPSEKLSRYAAAMLINTPYIDDLNAAFRAKAISESIGPTARRAGEWLRKYEEALLRPTPDAAALFGQFAATETDEISKAKEAGEWTTWEDEIVQSLFIQQYSLLDRTGRSEDGLPVLERWLARETGRTETLQTFVDLLVRAEAWPLLLRTGRQFDRQFQPQPLLLYSLARANQASNFPDVAKTLVDRARSTKPMEKLEHWQMASALYLRGLREYAEGEYQYLIDLGPPRDDYTVMSKFRLADLLADRERFTEAAELLSQSLAAIQEDSNLRAYIADDPTWLPARIHWLLAEKFRAAGDFTAQAASLWEAAKLAPTDADVLISLYRHPQLSADERERLKKLIDEATTVFQKSIAAKPDDGANYNQFAWLAANTGGDAQAAIQASHKSLELRPGASGYLDTLGRCYFAARDYSNAVKYQAMAVKLDPNSPSLNRQLAEFRKALDESLAPSAKPGDR